MCGEALSEFVTNLSDFFVSGDRFEPAEDFGGDARTLGRVVNAVFDEHERVFECVRIVRRNFEHGHAGSGELGGRFGGDDGELAEVDLDPVSVIDDDSRP